MSLVGAEAETGSEMIDIAIVGAGAAGMMAAIWAGRTIAGTRSEAIGSRHDLISSDAEERPPDTVSRRNRVSIVAFDGARSLGAKILVAGGGRCNVTHDVVDAREYAGSSTNAIRKVLKRFDVRETTVFFRELGVELKREDTGKLFPVTDDARTVLNALLNAARQAKTELRYPWRVTDVQFDPSRAAPFTIEGYRGQPRNRGGNGRGEKETVENSSDPQLIQIHAQRVVFAPGGRALPRSGSDGAGHEIIQRLGHALTTAIFPALVPLIVDPSSDPLGVRELAGVSTIATLDVHSGTGKRLKSVSGSTLFTHFGLSGPGPMDISRYLTDARRADPQAMLHINWLPELRAEAIDADLVNLGKRSVIRYVRSLRVPNADRLPERLVMAICRAAGVEPDAVGHTLRREQRLRLVEMLTSMVMPVAGDRGWNAAETTAGGVPLSEIHLKTMESRITPGLYLCGEICDVDGRIGGYNFQWAWASGYVAGIAAAKSLNRPSVN
ncbi:MAG: aminoacetone oxidase family FAD-binding enzyme, partial [Planctomycetota bacterium]